MAGYYSRIPLRAKLEALVISIRAKRALKYISKGALVKAALSLLNTY